ncbi:MAG: DUF6804 family protein [Bacteroidota bacterium]
MKFSVENQVKTALAILLAVCLFDMPYGYYQLLRFVAVVGFAILAYYEYERKVIPLVILYVALAFLFQPLQKVALGRELWMAVDLVIAVGLVVSILIRRKR